MAMSDCSALDTPRRLISVLVTVYNKEAFLKNCIRSLLTQSVSCFDIIVVDDGSEDNSWAVCGEMLSKRESIRIRQPHSGVAAARNNALSLVRSEYFIFLDADDSLNESALEQLADCVHNCAPDLAVYGFCYALPDGTRKHKSQPFAYYKSPKEIRENFLSLWESGLMYSVCNKLFRTSLVRSSGLYFENREIGEDLAFCRQYLSQCSSLQVIPACLYNYTCHIAGSLSTSFRADLYQLRLKEHREMRAYFQKMGCTGTKAEHYLSARHIGRILGCIENECAARNGKSLRERYQSVRRIALDAETQTCVKAASFSDWKMSALRLLLCLRNVPLIFLSGICMAICHNLFPRLFVKLKTARRS